MNPATLLSAIALHGALFVSVAAGFWYCFRRQSGARMVAGGRVIMASTLLLAFGEAAVAFVLAVRPAEVAAAGSRTAQSPPLPGNPGAAWQSPLWSPEYDSADSSTLSHKNSAEPRRFWEWKPDTASLLSAIWLAGAGIIFASRVCALVARCRLVRQSHPVTDPAWLELLAQLAGSDRITLRRHPATFVPCAWGATILLPAGAGAWPLPQLRMVLTHECAHLRRHDSFWQTAACCFLALQWFNPLAWAVVRRCRFAGERAADDAVLASSGDAPAYAGLLLACARSLPAGARSAVCSMAGPSGVQRRIERILDEEADRRPASAPLTALWSGTAISIVAAVLQLTPLPALAEGPPPFPPETALVPVTHPAASVHNLLQTVIFERIEWDAKPLGEAILELRQRLQVNIILRIAEEKRVTLNLKEIRAGDVITRICEVTGIRAEILPGGTIVFAPVDSAPVTSTVTFPLTEDQISRFGGEAGAKAVLEKAGVKFPGEAFAALSGTRLVIRNTPDQHARVATWLESGPTDAPFDWSPVTLNGTGYVAASKVRHFYSFYYILPGNQNGGTEYRFVSASSNGDVPFVMSWKSGGDFFNINDIRVFLRHPVRDHQGTLWLSRADLAWTLEPLLRPAPEPAAPPLTTVIIDAGHGGEDYGTQGLRGMESIYNLEVAAHLRDKLQAAEWNVVMTREEEKFVPRAARSRTAGAHPHAIFVSIHFGGNPDRSGFETFYLDPAVETGTEIALQTKERLRKQNLPLAMAVHSGCVKALSVTDGGLRASSFGLLADLQIPGVLVEGGNLLNVADAALIADANYRERIAASILQGLESYRRAAGRSPR